MRGRISLLALAIASACSLWRAPCAAQARELRWKALDVEAFLDADGALHVRERHDIVFSGDWNGGERTFDLHAGQSIELERVSRVDPASGESRALSEGDLDRVDHYAYSSDTDTLRWRSRAASDPPFAGTELVYVIEYVYHGALASSGDGVRLAHDFAFRRPSAIGAFTLRLRLDSGWQAESPIPVRYASRDLAPTDGFVVELELAPPSSWAMRRYALFALLVAFPLLVFGSLLWFESQRGRLAPLERVPEDPAWLDEHLLRFKPELVAVLWDYWGDPDRDAVAALLARMELEQKIATRVAHGQLQLELRVARDSLEGYERALVDGFFFAGDSTSTAAVQAHYRRVGFNPGRLLRPLVDQAKQRLGPLRPWWMLAGPALALVLLGVLRSATAPGPALARTLPLVFGGVFVSAFGAMLAAKWRSRLDYGPGRIAMFGVPALLPPLAAGILLAFQPGMVLQAAVGVVLIALGWCAFMVSFACGNESAAGLALRRELTAIRAELERRLTRRARLPDAHVPYLFAYGLASDSGDWHVAEPNRERGWSSSTSPAQQPYAGGGGAFGGAGASGAWVTAVGALSSGVSSPSSSSSSSGGSSGSSSSGGGRAGGW
ncbi:MAG TPA: DUF2207 domain-containing protein [Polyangiales bacterium]|nr:DUF2207 domain-containing protein [Polyangiales bacterium]